METNPLSKWCRICSSEFNAGIFIFGEEAKRLYLQSKIRKYLALTVSLQIFVLYFLFYYFFPQITVEDKLPKMICEECYNKLDGFHRFATMALRNQDKMTKFVSTSNVLEQKNIENNSLLHTYLTKVSKQTCCVCYNCVLYNLCNNIVFCNFKVLKF